MSCCPPKPIKDHYKFYPDYRMKPLTEKFWSRHDSGIMDVPTSQVLHYEDHIEKTRNFDARCHSKLPRYTNQTYGWLPGYKIRFLEKCDLNMKDAHTMQKLAKELMQH